MQNPFTKHPKKVNETYFQHFFKAMSYSFIFFILTIKSFIHAIFPFLFEYSVSDKIKKIYSILEKRKSESIDRN